MDTLSRGCYQYLRVLGSMFNLPVQEKHSLVHARTFHNTCTRFRQTGTNLSLNNIKNGLHGTAHPEALVQGHRNILQALLDEDGNLNMFSMG